MSIHHFKIKSINVHYFEGNRNSQHLTEHRAKGSLKILNEGATRVNDLACGVRDRSQVTVLIVTCICKPLLPEYPQPGQLTAEGWRAYVETISGEE